jgi:hypothetical protein
MGRNIDGGKNKIRENIISGKIEKTAMFGLTNYKNALDMSLLVLKFAVISAEN